MPKKKQAPAKTKFWNMVETGEDSAEILLTGEFLDAEEGLWWSDSDVFVTPQGFREDLDKVKDKQNITIKFDSIGGDLYTGIAIFNALKELDAHKVGIVESIAASAATAPLMACDEIKVHSSSEVMIHSVKAVLGGCGAYSAEDLEKLKSSVEASDKALATIYSERTGKSIEECLDLMNAETWMTGKEAVDMGFADEVIEDEPEQIDMIPARVVAVVDGHKTEMIQPSKKDVENIAAKSAEKEAEKPMTLKDLCEKYPDLVKELEAKAAEKAVKDAENDIKEKAVAAERKRLMAIEKIENQIPHDMVLEAKYGEKPMTAAELSYQAMLKNAELGRSYEEAKAKDIDESNAAKVKAEDKSLSKEDKVKANNARLSELYKKMH